MSLCLSFDARSTKINSVFIFEFLTNFLFFEFEFGLYCDFELVFFPLNHSGVNAPRLLGNWFWQVGSVACRFYQ